MDHAEGPTATLERARMSRRVRLRDGLWLNVAEWGTGAPIVLLHGFTGSIEAWGRLPLELAREHRVIAIDLLGHGRSDPPPDAGRCAMVEVVSDVVDVLDTLGVGRATWMGYSMGGRIALSAAVAKTGDRVGGLVLESGSPGLETVAARRERREADSALASRLRRDGIGRFVTEWMAQPLFASQAAVEPARLERARALRMANDAESLGRVLEGLGTGSQPSLWRRLSEVNAPTLILAGELDARYVEIGRAMEREIADARLEVVPGAGHASHFERPGIWLDRVLRFLDSWLTR